MPLQVRSKTNNATTFFGPFSGNASQFGPPTAGEAAVWMPSEVEIISATQAVETALGLGNARTLTFQNGSAVNQAGSSLVLAHPDLSVDGLIGGTLQAGVSVSQLEAVLARQVDTGSPPTEESRVSFFYRDLEDARRNWQGFGSVTGNQTVNATPEYFGMWQHITTQTEAIARTIVPVPCTLMVLHGRYSGTLNTTHELAIMIDGVATVIGDLVGGSTPSLVTFTPEIHLEALEEISFRVRRTDGSGTNMVLGAVCAFIPDTP